MAVVASMAGLGARGAAVHDSAPAPLPVLLFVIAEVAAWTAYRARRRAREDATRWSGWTCM